MKGLRKPDVPSLFQQASQFCAFHLVHTFHPVDLAEKVRAEASVCEPDVVRFAAGMDDRFELVEAFA